MNNISIKTGNLFDKDFRQNEIYRQQIDNRLKLEFKKNTKLAAEIICDFNPTQRVNVRGGLDC